jgi:hypothetical protein
MGFGGTSGTNQITNPTTMYAPVSFGGDIISGNVGNGPIGMDGSSYAEGGKFDFNLEMPMPMPMQQMQLQNLKSKFIKKVGKGLKKTGKVIVKVDKAADKYIKVAELAYGVPALQNLDWMSDMGAGLTKASKIGADAYKVGKTIAPIGG